MSLHLVCESFFAFADRAIGKQTSLNASNALKDAVNQQKSEDLSGEILESNGKENEELLPESSDGIGGNGHTMMQNDVDASASELGVPREKLSPRVQPEYQPRDSEGNENCTPEEAQGVDALAGDHIVQGEESVSQDTAVEGDLLEPGMRPSNHAGSVPTIANVHEDTSPHESPSGSTASSVHEDEEDKGTNTGKACTPAPPKLSPKKPELLHTPLVKNATFATGTTPKSTIKSRHKFDSPQVGTTLLRRESLRSRRSPSKRAKPSDDASPKKTQGIKKRDTLQEREILQQFNAKAGTEQSNESHTVQSGNASDTATEKATGLDDGIEHHPSHESSTSMEEGQASIKSDRASSPAGEIVEGRLQECPSSPEQDCQQHVTPPTSYVTEVSSLIQKPTMEDTITEKHSETVAEGGAVENAESTEHKDLPAKQTRSGTRFSDDTSMLKDFVHRAQVKKAAKELPNLSGEIDRPTKSPRRSPRKFQVSDNDEATSPLKARHPTARPGTPPQKPLQVDIDGDGDENITETISFRRSTRSRLPAPSKTAPSAPNFIPLRRGDGTEPVVIQKSQAQDVAIVTRANTRRNKGQAKPPMLALQTLPPESPDKQSAKGNRPRREVGKVVAWAETLASYQDSGEAVGEAEEPRPRMRRVRGLGTVNGTPAKKTSTAKAPLPSNDTPAPKRRGKVR